MHVFTVLCCYDNLYLVPDRRGAVFLVIIYLMDFVVSGAKIEVV